ncbi:MAG: DUF3592 domain-containing protein [Polyangiaceae bacterium]|nr:DUF3592 domain-containing protein [Polyangiaceae bacterium]MBK8941308.1 DUF3592 domain-containing protein [Polyangiaceae bacterium]
MEILIVGLAFLLTGVPFVGLAMRVFARDRAIARWPRVDGVVTSARLQSSTRRVTDKNTGLHSSSTYYTPVVRYTYAVGGETFEGTSIARSLDKLSTTHDAAGRIIAQYPPQARVAVLHDPAEPKTAYLEVRRSVGGIILLAFGLLWLALRTLVTTISLT